MGNTHDENLVLLGVSGPVWLFREVKMIVPVKVFTPYSSLHVGFRAPDEVTWSWKARGLTGKEMALELRAIADDIEIREAAVYERVAVEKREMAQTVGLKNFERLEKERVKKERADWIASEQDFFRRGGVRDTEGNTIVKPSSEE